MEIFKWLKENYDVLGLIGGGVAAVVGACWTVFTYVDAKRSSKTDAPVQNVYNYGVPIEQYETSMRQLEAKLRAEVQQPAPNANRISELEQQLQSTRDELALKKQKFEELTKR